MALTDISTIKRLCRQYGLKPSALVGQNFLVDETVLSRIVAAASPRAGENVLEIGPGFGVLTERLLAAGSRVLAVEKDRRLASCLQKRFAGQPNLKLMAGDILRISNEDLTRAFLTWPEPGKAGQSSPTYRLIANLPYQITGKVIRKFISDNEFKPTGLAVLLQKEVAERICAKVGHLNLLAIAVQLYGKPKIEFCIPRKAFFPIPKVDSALVQIRQISGKPAYPIRDIKKFWRVLKASFSAPRKQIHNNLSAGLAIDAKLVRKILDKAKIVPQVRPQVVSIEQWAGLVAAIDEERLL
jgi:16S rRNA (adenine1518-N6/adenine1519-N6)-dimethyltransferase